MEGPVLPSPCTSRAAAALPTGQEPFAVRRQLTAPSSPPRGSLCPPGEAFLPLPTTLKGFPVFYLGLSRLTAPPGCSWGCSAPSPQALLYTHPQKIMRQTPPARHGTIDLFISISYSSSTFPYHTVLPFLPQTAREPRTLRWQQVFLKLSIKY